MFKRALQRTRSILARDVPTEWLLTIGAVGLICNVPYAAISMAKSPDPQPAAATRPAHKLDALTVQTIGEGENAQLLVIAISDTGAVDMEFIPQPVRVIVAQ